MSGIGSRRKFTVSGSGGGEPLKSYSISSQSDDQCRRKSQREIVGDDIRSWVIKTLTDGRKPRYKEHLKIISRDMDISKCVNNKDKNAFTNVVCFNHSRVLLKKVLPDDKKNGYINASYVNSQSGLYILTQNPMTNTAADYWRCVWQEKVKLIVIFSGSDDFQFYPMSKKKKLSFGEGKRFTILTDDVKTNKDYDQYQLTVMCRDKKQKEKRNIQILDYKKWNKDCLPDYHSILDFMNQFWKLETNVKSDLPNNQTVPSLIQCSSGNLASATFYAINRGCKQLNRGGRCRSGQNSNKITERTLWKSPIETTLPLLLYGHFPIRHQQRIDPRQQQICQIHPRNTKSLQVVIYKAN